MIIFETPRLIVRRFTGNDYENFFALNGDPDVMKYIRTVRTRAECDMALHDQILVPKPHEWLGRWAVDVKENGVFAGSFVIVPIPGDEEKIQLGYALLPAFWGKGFATELTKAGIEYFRNRTPLDILYAVTETPNINSENVLVKNGFQFLNTKMEEGKELRVFMICREN